VKTLSLVVTLCVLLLLSFAIGRLESQTGKQKAIVVAGTNAEALQAELNSGWRVTHVSGTSQQRRWFLAGCSRKAATGRVARHARMVGAA